MRIRKHRGSSAPDQRERDWSQAISSARTRVDRLLAERDRSSGARKGAAQIHAELANAFEELTVAEEELRDQSQRLAAVHDALEAELRRYQDLFEFMPDGYLVTDEAGAVRELNRAALALLGRTRAQVIGCPIVLLLADDARAAFRRALATARKAPDDTGEVLDLDVEARGGARLPAMLTLAPIRTVDHRFAGFRVLLRDVAERRRAEEAARASSVAQAANEAKDAFLATLSHELRNPLNAILGWSCILRTDSVDDDDLGIALETIDRNARQLNRMVADLLDVSRIAQDKLSFELQRSDVVDVVAGAFDAVRDMLLRAHHHLTVHLQDPGPVLADPVRLQQIVVNLLGNAVKFTPHGGELELSLGVHQRTIEIVVRDSGCGIAADMLPQVFDRFRQSKDATTQRGGGLGLGLSIARTLARMHGGDLTAESAGAARGATFTLRLPLRRPHHDAARGLATQESHGEIRLLRGLKTLVCPDDARAVHAARQLARAGATVRTSTVAAAPSIDQAWQPDALVVIVPPSATEAGLLENIEALERRRGGRLPLAVVTRSATAMRRWLAHTAEVGLCTREVEPAILSARLAFLARVSGWGAAR